MVVLFVRSRCGNNLDVNKRDDASTRDLLKLAALLAIALAEAQMNARALRVLNPLPAGVCRLHSLRHCAHGPFYSKTVGCWTAKGHRLRVWIPFKHLTEK